MIKFSVTFFLILSFSFPNINQIVTDRYQTIEKKIVYEIQGEKINEKIINCYIDYLISNTLIHFIRR